MTKEERIKEAWVNQVGYKRYNALKEELVLDGFLFYQPSDLIEVDTKIIDGLPFYRPKSLQGIENNNRWIKIESKKDLPKNHIPCHFLYENNVITGYYNGRFNFGTLYVEAMFVTHYQPIEKPKPPLF